MFLDQTKMQDMTVEDMERRLQDGYRKSLY
jgi:hypothetical protein